MKDGSNEAKLLTWNEKSPDYFSASTGLKVVHENIVFLQDVFESALDFQTDVIKSRIPFFFLKPG